MQPASILAQIPLFNGLPKDGLETLTSAARRKRYQPDENIVSFGETGHAMYIILGGKAAVSRLNDDGVRVHFRDLARGDYFGELAMLADRPRMADVIASNLCDCMVIDRSTFVRVVLKSPDMALTVISHLCDLISESNDARLSRPSVRDRVIRTLLDMGGRNSPGFDERPVVRISRQALADRILARRETVSRELSQLVKEGYLHVQGREVVLLRPKALQKLCGR